MKPLQPLFLMSFFLALFPAYSLPGWPEKTVIKSGKFLEANSNTFREMLGKPPLKEITSRNRKVALVIASTSFVIHWLTSSTNNPSDSASSQSTK